MNLVDISYHDNLAANANGINFENWFQYGWRNHVLSFHLQRLESDKTKIEIPKNICFSIGSYFIELYDSYFEEEPYTEYIPPASGELTTLVLGTTIKIKTGKIRGKICLHSVNQPVVSSDYELSVQNTNIQMIVGMSIVGDGLDYNYCIFDSPQINLTFLYQYESQMISVFDKITDSNTKSSLESYIFQYFIKDLGPAIEDYQLSSLAIKQSVSGLCGQDDNLKNVLQFHNIKLHHAFNVLAKKIVHLTNLLSRETKLLLNLYGLAEQLNGQRVLQMYQGIISNLGSLATKEDKDVIVSRVNPDSVRLHIPLEFEEIKLEYKYPEQVEDGVDQTQIYSINNALITLKISKLDEKTVKFEVEKFRIMDFSPWSKYRIEMALDYSVSSVIVEGLMPHLTQALKDDCLHKLTLDPDVKHFNMGEYLVSSESPDSCDDYEYYEANENEEGRESDGNE